MEQALNYIEVDVVQSLKSIEELKVALLEAQWLCNQGTLKGSEQQIIKGLADLVGVSYLLAKRLGFDFSRLDAALLQRLGEWRSTDRWGLETAWGDLSLLESYLAPEDE